MLALVKSAVASDGFSAYSYFWMMYQPIFLRMTVVNPETEWPWSPSLL